MTQNKEIATNILNQLGNNRFITMTGAKDFLIVENGLKFKIGRNASNANYCTITLNAKDLYDLVFEHVSISRKTFEVKRTEKSKLTDIYFDQLQPFFTDVTGLYTSL